MRRFKTSSLPWFCLAFVVFALAVVLLSGLARNAVEALAFFMFIGACIRAVMLSVADNDVTSSSLRSPAERTLAFMGSDSGYGRRQRRRRRDVNFEADKRRRPVARGSDPDDPAK